MLRLLGACGLIIVFSIVVVLGAAAYILYSSAPDKRLETIVSLITDIETALGEIKSSLEVQREPRTQVNTATPIPLGRTSSSARIFATPTLVRSRGTSIPPPFTSGPPSNTLIPPTATPIPPTVTLIPATVTSLPPTDTAIPPTATPVHRTTTSIPATNTPVLPSATPITPTETMIPPSATSIPTATKPFSITMFSSPLRRYVRGPVNLRQGPGTSYDKIGLVDAGTRIDVIGQSGDWYIVIHNHTEAFIAGWLTYEVSTSTPTQIRTATRVPTTATSIPPSATAVPPSRTPAPTTGAAYSVNRYASPRTRYTHGTVNLRKGPGTSYDLVGSVSVNADLQVVGKSGDWYLIRHNGREVFIAGWLTYDAPLQQSSSQPVNRQQPAQQPVVRGQQPAQQPAARVQQPAQQPAAPQQPSYSCSPRKNCGDMSSCAEARFHLAQCGRGGLDRDKDGVPCESICPGG